MAKVTQKQIEAKKLRLKQKETSANLDDQVYGGFSPRKMPKIEAQAISNYKTSKSGYVYRSR